MSLIQEYRNERARTMFFINRHIGLWEIMVPAAKRRNRVRWFRHALYNTTILRFWQGLREITKPGDLYRGFERLTNG